MAIQIKSLAKGILPTSEGQLYVVPTNKSAIVKNIRLVNTGTSSVTVNLFIRRASGGTSYRIAPKDLSIAPGAAFIDDQEVTVEFVTDVASSDRIQGYASAGTVDYVLSGIERDV
jgi:hypothetical protein